MSEFLDTLLDETSVDKPVEAPKDFMSQLLPKQQEKALEIAQTIDINDMKNIMYFGSNIQEKLSLFSNELAEQVHKSDTSNVKQAMANLVDKINQVNWQEISSKGKGFLAKLRPKSSPSQKLISKYQKLGVEVDYLAKRLDKEKQLLLTEIELLDRMYEINKDYYVAISIYIAAGKQKLLEIENTILPELHAQDDLMKSEGLQDLQHFKHQLEKRVHDLHLSQQIALQKAPQIRMIQENHRMLAEKIQSSILNTIPLWKDQFIIGLTLERQKQAIDMQKKVTDTTNELLLKNSELLRTNTLEVAKENERGIVDMETLKQTQSNLLATIDEVFKIQEDGRKKREQAEQELLEMDQQLKTYFLKNKNSST